MEKKTAKLLALIFILILGTVFLSGLLLPDKKFSPEENRMLQQKPKFTLASYMEGRYEKKAEAYADDQFPLRNLCIKVKTSFALILGNVEANGVYKGKDHYLLEEIQKPDPKATEETLKSLAAFKGNYPSLQMYFLIAPNAGCILADKLPMGVVMPDQTKIIGDFYKKIQETGCLPVPVEKTFNQHKKDTQLYYRTDHHWTTDGAYLAYREAAKVLDLTSQIRYKPYTVKKDFRGTLSSKSGFENRKNDSIKIYLPEDKSYKNSIIYYGDSKEKTTRFYRLENLQKKDAYTVFGGSNHPIYRITTPVKTQRRLLLFKDSYANSMIPFLAQDFREIIVVDPRYYFERIDDLILSSGITDVLFLYNANTFFSDNSLAAMLKP